MPAHRRAIAVMRPRLPTAESILPYLRRIDDARLYSNFGPLAQALESRLAARWERPAAAVVSLANATLGLSACLMACCAPRGSLCLMPAWTFVATAHAARAAGLEPFLADVDEHSGALTPAIAEAALAAAPAPVGAVMVVQPFGRPLDMDGWQDFRRRTGLAVIIDAAAAFDTVTASPLPTVVSLHATKVLGAGEGGFALCDDPDLAQAIRRASNFGFYITRESHAPALNAKMSEY
ncbi:MAG TPA: aminotransferase class I/II-fold pyridoxal phosphate-dependent enzyme, partial [Magnetospirillum sp.]|nr:aminotransferase class I/II-fold pyridoxal phosphate-dependent enzyme [Magnetospirillum sp.]